MAQITKIKLTSTHLVVGEVEVVGADCYHPLPWLPCGRASPCPQRHLGYKKTGTYSKKLPLRLYKLVS